MILSYRDLAKRWGIREATLRQWRRRGKLPEPDLVVSGSPAWKLETIKTMEDNDGRVGAGGIIPKATD